MQLQISDHLRNVSDLQMEVNQNQLKNRSWVIELGQPGSSKKRFLVAPAHEEEVQRFA